MQIETAEFEDPVLRQAIASAIGAYNAQHADTKPVRRLAFVLRGTDGAITGGMLAVAYWDWLHVDMLVLPADRRRGGIGSRLMQAAENEAVALGCRGVWLDTATFQAPGFYRKLGYTVFATLDDYPPPHQRFWLTRTPIACRPVDLDGIETINEPTPEVGNAIRDGLLAYNNDALADPAPRAYYAIGLRGADGRIEGGLYARSGRGWMFVELLVLPEHARGRGLGSRLMRMAEETARAQGCRGIWLDTASFQARPFYEKLGFSTYGRIDNQPTGHTRFFLQKRLDR
jgi:ribosomal protein S18 acetylase RimI-like enzyme